MSRADREVVARLGNCILGLADHKMMLFDTSILYTYEASLKFQVNFINVVAVVNPGYVEVPLTFDCKHFPKLLPCITHFLNP